MSEARHCVVIPTFNNERTIGDVVSRSLECGHDVIVVNDGSTDSTGDRLREFGNRITIVSYNANRGKGYALAQGLKRARELGYSHAVTLDGDGQHYPEDAHLLIAESLKHPHDIIIGRRGEHDGYKSTGSKFANAFSNFWFAIQTLTRARDTQSGFRCYPLDTPRPRFYTRRYEAELAVLIDARWKGRQIRYVPVRVFYPEASARVSHFRPAADFTRISLLNTIVTPMAFIIGYPMMFVHKFKRLWMSLIGYTVFAIGTTIIVLPAALVRYLTPGSPKWYGHLMSRACRLYTHMIPFCHFRYDTSAVQDLALPRIVIANHTSLFDIIAICALLPDTVMMVGDWVWRNPLLRLIVRPIGCLPASEGVDKATEHFGKKISEGYSIVIFPEGTRSVDNKVKRFRTGAFELAIRLKVQILPLKISGAGQVLSRNDILGHPGDIVVTAMSCITPQTGETASELKKRVRKLY